MLKKKYNELNEKYSTLIKINLDNIRIEEDRNELFCYYSNKITEMSTKNNELSNLVVKLNMDIEKKSLEIRSLKNYIRTVSLEIKEKKKNK